MKPLLTLMDTLKLRRAQPGSAVVGLSFDGSRLEAVEIRRSNGSVEVRKAFSGALALDPLSNPPELAGREIRKLLDEHGIRERWCTVCIPPSWALTLTTKLPALAEADLRSFLQVEAERGFPYSPGALVTAESRFKTAGGEQWTTVMAVPRAHLTRLEAVLGAAQLRPASFSFGICALQPAGTSPGAGVLTLLPGESSILMQLTAGGGIALLRTLEGAYEAAGGGTRELQVETVLREIRITLGQLAPELQEAVKTIRVLGNGEDARELAEVLQDRYSGSDIQVEQTVVQGVEGAEVNLPAGTAVTAALALGVRRVADCGVKLEFLPPKTSAWEQFSARYSSPRLVTAGATAGAVAAAVLLVFFVQQTLLLYWGHRWNGIKTQVHQLEDTQANIRKFRPWYDDTYRELTVMRRLTEAFPEDGTVSAKQVEIRDPGKPGEPVLVTCTGTARSRTALLRVKDKLGAVKNVANIHTEQERGTSPMEFIFNFQWNEGGQ
jgi:hypothetical protein